ncbi:hypothetical protein KIW84_030244 [Lathyrus oleraceus]|uniref:Uncharacterized protein n=1 Tax=Pisum sativum TaxID=3888 RepID=A0A9D4XPV9_PEA|nr:hypothetical protein KIW84_030244 [Pisum sativum]
MLDPTEFCEDGKPLQMRFFSQVSILGILSKSSASISIKYFVLLKAFKLDIPPPTPQLVKEAIWSPPILNWMKGKSDGTSTGNPSMTSYGRLFRDDNGILEVLIAIFVISRTHTC